jgi:hypothetical protein
MDEDGEADACNPTLFWTAGNRDGRGLSKSGRGRSLGREIAKKGAERRTVAIIGRQP